MDGALNYLASIRLLLTTPKQTTSITYFFPKYIKYNSATLIHKLKISICCCLTSPFNEMGFELKF